MILTSVGKLAGKNPNSISCRLDSKTSVAFAAMPVRGRSTFGKIFRGFAVGLAWFAGAALSVGVVCAQPDSGRFIDNKNATITDTKTGLMWQKQDSYHERKKGLNWYEAVEYVERKNSGKFAGYGDWRLPTLEEFKSIWDARLPVSDKDQARIGLPEAFEPGGSYFLWASNERGLNYVWYFGLGQAEEYFNLKDSGDLNQGAKLVRKTK